MMNRRMLRWLPSIVLVVFCCMVVQVSSSSSAKREDSTSTNTGIPRRVRNLDHLDVETLAYYVGMDPVTSQMTTTSFDSSSYVGHDVAVLFYAQWCEKCHALAPYWDQMATRLEAGSRRSSNLIMGLFDCERNPQYSKMCTELGVNAYPTLLYIGSCPYHDVNPLTSLFLGRKKAAGPMGPTTVARTVKFQGNWQYTEAVMDWIKTMKGLSAWHRASLSGGWIHNLRRAMLGWIPILGGGGGHHDKKSSFMSLPVGIPTTTSNSGSSSESAAADAAANKAMVQLLQTELQTKEKEIEELNTQAKHASTLVDVMQFPRGKKKKSTKTMESDSHQKNTTTSTNTTTTSTNNTIDDDYDDEVDVFGMILQNNGWNFEEDDKKTLDPVIMVVRACVMELSLDYCSRMSVHVATDYIASMSDNDNNNLVDFLEAEAELKQDIRTTEPYCSIVEDCLITDYKDKECRPESCPFTNQAACHYVSACLDESIQTSYAVALELIKEGDPFPPPPTGNNKSKDSKRTKRGGGGGWGMGF